MNSLIGIDKFAYAVNTKDDKEGTAYSPTVFLEGISELTHPTGTKRKEYAGDEGVEEVCTKQGAANIGLKLADLPNRDLAALLREDYDANSGLFTLSQRGKSPYAAIMYRCQKENGAYRYVKLLKARGVIEKSTHKAVFEDVTPSEMMMNFYGVKRKFDGKIEYRIDSDDPNFPIKKADMEAFEAAWFGDPDYILKEG